MIWHIFKKDLRLQWKFVALMALVQFANLTLLIKISPFLENATLRNLFQLLFMATLVGIPFLVAAGVHLDPIPGVRQDWLVRPIRRVDLLLAKSLFVIAAVHVPMLLADLIRGLAFGFPFGASLEAALSHGLFVLLVVSLPLLAFASLTKNTMEAITAALVVFLAVAAFSLIFQPHGNASLLPTTGLAWVQEAAHSLLLIVVAGVVLFLQYFRRRTLLSRGVTVAAVVVAMFSMYLPWNQAFAIQQRLSSDPSAAASVNVAFDPAAERFHRSPDMYGDEERAVVAVPLRFANMPDGSVLISDRVEISRGDTGELDGRIGSVLARRRTGDDRPLSYLIANLSADLYQRIKDESQPVHLKLYLTLFRPAGSSTVPAINGRLHTPDLGDCATKMNSAETAIRLGCVPLAERPSCFGVQLRVPNGPANPEQFQCQGDYAPFFDAVLITPAGSQNIPFRDVNGLAKYPVDGTLLNQAQLAIHTFEAVDHFTRTVEIPGIRLRDWTMQ
ncbi:MAG TPA: hypothetical protein VGN17_30845 [Bryobacteraceae bacterium]|jgi:hypothetical protein